MMAAMSPAETDCDFLAVIGVHLQQATDALPLALGGVQRVAARIKLAGVDAQIGQLADMRVGLDFEDQSRRTADLAQRFARQLIVGSGSMPMTGGTSSGDGR